jgi:hypothetical protein
MRWGAAAILAVVVVGILTGCGGGSGTTTEEINSGPPPDVAAKATRRLIERQIKKRNQVSHLRCEKETGKVAEADVDLWKCEVRLKKYEDDGAEIQIVVNGSNGQYEISECTFVEIGSGPSICKRIH